MKMGKKWVIYVALVIVFLGVFMGISIDKHKDDAKLVDVSSKKEDAKEDVETYEIVKVKDNEDEVCIQVIDEFYEDSQYVYMTSTPCVLDAYVVRSSLGVEMSVKEALANGKIDISYLDKAGIKYFTNEKSVAE